MKSAPVILLLIAELTQAPEARAEGDVSFTLTNSSSQTVTGFFVSTPDEPEVDVLSGGTLTPGATFDAVVQSAQSACVRNLRIVYVDESVVERSDVDVCNMDGYVIE